MAGGHYARRLDEQAGAPGHSQTLIPGHMRGSVP